MRALALVEVVVAGVDGDLAAVDLGDLRDDAVHELAVVRGHQQRARAATSGTLSSQMIDSMSRWFVGSSISRTSGRPSSTRAIATRIFQPPDSAPDVAVDPLVVEPEAVQHLARLALERVAAEVLVLLLHLAEARQDAVHVAGPRRIGHRLLQRLELVVQVADPAAAGDRFVEHRAARTSPRRPGGSSRSSASSAPRRRLRRRLPRRRSCGRASSCRRRSGRPGRPSRRD